MAPSVRWLPVTLFQESEAVSAQLSSPPSEEEGGLCSILRNSWVNLDRHYLGSNCRAGCIGVHTESESMVPEAKGVGSSYSSLEGSPVGSVHGLV